RRLARYSAPVNGRPFAAMTSSDFIALGFLPHVASARALLATPPPRVSDGASAAGDTTTNLLGNTRRPGARLYCTPGCPYLRNTARRHFAYNSWRDCAAASPMKDTPSGAGNGWNTTNVRPNASASRRTTDRLPIETVGIGRDHTMLEVDA